MPLPGYIVCSQHGSIDVYTNGVSCFNIFEQVEIAPPAPAGRGQPLFVRVLATWLLGPNDSPDQEFDCEVRLLHLTDKEPQELGTAQFQPFKFSIPFYRCTVPAFFVPDVTDPGLFVFECRIRPVGQEEWAAAQTFPILLNKTEPQPDAKPQPDQSSAGA
jgi:hypothetical protein